MREIKFRAWDIFNKVMVYSRENKEVDWWDGIKCSSIEMVNGRFDEERYKWMQYTGIKDKKGNDIYEYDLVIDKYGTSRVVKFCEGCFVLVNQGESPDLREDLLIMQIYDELKVVGNAHEMRVE